MNQHPWILVALTGLMMSCAGLLPQPQPASNEPLPEVHHVPVQPHDHELNSVLHVVQHEGDECKLCSVYEVVAASTFVVRSDHGLGSALLVAEGGLAATNAHVVGDAREVRIYQNDGLELKARVLKTDTVEDLALIQIMELGPGRYPLPLALGKPRTGSEVYAIGHPLGLGWTISRGIVSGLPILGKRPMVQTDAPISSGNSGGPLVDEHGHVIGIITEKIAGQGAEGLAFARPSGVLARFLAEAGFDIKGAHPGD